jgi:hypothetical protein
VLYAGTAPAALWRSENDGEAWELNRALWNVPTRPSGSRAGRALSALDLPVAGDRPARSGVSPRASG